MTSPRMASGGRLRSSYLNDFNVSEGFDQFMGRHRVREERDGGNCRWRYDPETPAIVIFNPPDSYHVSGAILEAYFLYRE